MHTVVAGAFDDYGVVNRAISNLRSHGIKAGQISVLGSGKDAAQILRKEAYPQDSKFYLMKSTALGAISGAIFALLCFATSTFHTQIVSGLLAAISGITAGGYLGLMIGVVTRLDIGAGEKILEEVKMTRGRIWLGVETHKIKEEKISHEVMKELGAIKLVSGEEANGMDKERFLDRIEGVVWIVSLLLLGLVIAFTVLSVQKELAEITASIRWLLFTAYAGLLGATVYNAFAGLSTRGARKWFNMEFE